MDERNYLNNVMNAIEPQGIGLHLIAVEDLQGL